MQTEELEAKLQGWHRKKYGSKPIDFNRSVVKLAEEVGELAKAILKGDIENAKEECADVAIIASHICRGLGSSVFDEMDKKYYILERRLATGVKERK